MGATTNQAFNSGVGNVLNFEQLNISADLGMLGSALTRAIPERAALALTMIDRREQREAIIERLEELRALQTGGSLLVTVSGCTSDLPQALVLRCARIEFVDALGSASPWTFFGNLEWPEGAQSVDAVVRTVREAASVPPGSTRAQTEAAIARKETNICFSHVIDGEAWALDRGALMRRWIEYIGSNQLRPAPGYYLVAFLCVQTGEKPTRFCRDLLASTNEADGMGNVLVTSPLRLIRPLHIGNWVSTAARYLKDDRVEAELVDLAARIFEQGVSQSRFSVIFHRAQEALAHAFGSRTRFVETTE